MLGASPRGLLPLAENYPTRDQSGRHLSRRRKRSLLSRFSEVARTSWDNVIGTHRAFVMVCIILCCGREWMTIYAENFKDKISFALGYASPPAVYNRLFGRRTKFSSHHPWDRRATNNTEVRICNQATS